MTLQGAGSPEPPNLRRPQADPIVTLIQTFIGDVNAIKRWKEESLTKLAKQGKNAKALSPMDIANIIGE
jgi:hypothetical protein